MTDTPNSKTSRTTTMTSMYYFYDVLSGYKVTPEQFKKQQEEWKRIRQKLMEEQEKEAMMDYTPYELRKNEGS